MSYLAQEEVKWIFSNIRECGENTSVPTMKFFILISILQTEFNAYSDESTGIHKILFLNYFSLYTHSETHKHMHIHILEE